MVTPPRYNEPAVVTTCIGYVLACNARYMAAKACGDGCPHGTATFEGGALGDGFYKCWEMGFYCLHPSGRAGGLLRLERDIVY